MQKKAILIAVLVVVVVYVGIYTMTVSISNQNPSLFPVLQLPRDTTLNEDELSKIQPVDPEILIKEGKQVIQARGDVVIVFPFGASTMEPKQNPFPAKLLITQGDTVTWNNLDMVNHTVTSGYSTQKESVGSIFDSGTISSGHSFSYTFTEENIDGHHYFCSIHPWETGEILVQRLIG